jgi:D-lactate dehydrogenase
MLDVLDWAGFAVAYPDGLAGLCCSLPLASKGFGEAAQRLGTTTVSALWRASREGQDAIVTDASPCAKMLGDVVAHERAGGRPAPRVLDFTAFWAAEVLASPGRPLPRRPGAAILHPTCSLVRSGGLPDLLRVAEAHCESVAVPVAAECCGFAGDRGFLVPELTEAASAREADEVRALAGGGASLYSTCRTCEIGMSRAVGRAYRSIVHLVHEAVKGG